MQLVTSVLKLIVCHTLVYRPHANRKSGETASGISHEVTHPVYDQRQSKDNAFLNPTWTYWALQYLLLFES